MVCSFHLLSCSSLLFKTVLVKRKAKHCDIHHVLSLIQQRWQISPCLNIRNCSLVCTQMSHCIWGQRGGGVSNYGEVNMFPGTTIAYKTLTAAALSRSPDYRHCNERELRMWCSLALLQSCSVCYSIFLGITKSKRLLSEYKGVISLETANALVRKNMPLFLDSVYLRDIDLD